MNEETSAECFHRAIFPSVERIAMWHANQCWAVIERNLSWSDLQLSYFIVTKVVVVRCFHIFPSFSSPYVPVGIH